MRRRLFSISLLLASLPGLSLAQESLLIGSGDQIHIQVFDTPEMEQHPRVTDAGTVPLLFGGEVNVAGMTPAQAARKIEQTLVDKQYMLHPHVAVTVEDYGTQQVSVMGEVKSAGAYDITAPTSIITVISIAGGLTELADRHVTIERHSDPNQKITYFVSNKSGEALTNQILVYPGDTVLVPKTGIVYVLGDVGRPGGFPMSNNDSQMTVLQALAAAGAANKTAMLTRAKLVRGGTQGPTDIPVSLAEIQKGKTPDMQMQAGDVLYIPSSWMKNLMSNSSNIAASATSAMIYAHP